MTRSQIDSAARRSRDRGVQPFTEAWGRSSTGERGRPRLGANSGDPRLLVADGASMPLRSGPHDGAAEVAGGPVICTPRGTLSYEQRCFVAKEQRPAPRGRAGPDGRYEPGERLAEDVLTRVDSQGFAGSAMDGCTVQARDLPGTVRLVGRRALPGRIRDGQLGRREAVRFSTGGAIAQRCRRIDLVSRTRASGRGADGEPIRLGPGGACASAER